MVKNLILTPTKLNNFLRCKRKFLYHNLLLLPGRKKQSLVFGNCAHKALEETYRTYKKENKFPNFSFFKKIFERELKFQGANKTIQNACLAKLGTLKKWFEKAKLNPTSPIELEKKKIITLKGGIIFSGKYDKVEFEDEKKGLIRIIDYKTGKPDTHIRGLENTADLISEECDDYMRQLIAYKMLYEKDTYEPAKYRVSHGVLVFLEPVKNTSQKYNLTKGEYVNKRLAITGEMVNEFEDVVFRVWKQINSLEFDKLPEKDPKKCRDCAFNTICWE
ncbi:MAG: PD-(D/E)XK nuclease family protein [Candidatus Omnitrophota bacterium]